MHVTNAKTFEIYSDHLLEYCTRGIVITLLSTRMWETIRRASERGQRGASFVLVVLKEDCHTCKNNFTVRS